MAAGIKLTYLDGMSVAYEARLSEKLICIILVVGGGRRGLYMGVEGSWSSNCTEKLRL
jgi:hypothetical protein